MWGDTSYFNPRLREGGDLQPHHYKPSHHIFQSTPPRGRRQRRICLRLYRSNFNPRLREGGDIRSQGSFMIFSNFNPRLREGGDRYSHTLRHLLIHFNPRLREGGDHQKHFVKFYAEGISIHASAREATALITKIHLKHHISFQHTVHKSPFNVNYPFQ